MRKNIIWVKFAVFTLLNFIFLSFAFPVFYDKWFWWGSYYSHAPLVVIAFIWLLIKRLKNYEFTSGNLSDFLSGIIIIFVSILIYTSGLWKDIDSFITWGVFIFIAGNSVLFFSKKFVIKNAGIFIYLLLAIPVPQIIIDNLTFELNLFASYTSEILISLIYSDTIRNGNILQINGYNIAITPECSGLSNLLSMFSIIWLLALFQSKKIIAVIDYLISIPAAIISNILRIIIVTILAVNGYEKFALYDWHYEIGMTVFILIIIPIAIFNEFNFGIKDFQFRNSLTRLSSFLNKNSKLINTYIILLITLCFAAFILSPKNTPENTDNTAKEKLLTEKIPDSIGNWKSEDEILENYYFTTLGTNNLLMRGYLEKKTGSEKDKVYLYIIRSKDNVSAFHRPEVCLRGEGYDLLAHNDINLLINEQIKISAHRQLFQEGGKGLLVYYWYYINNKNIKNSTKFKLTFLFNKNKDSSGNFIRISKPVNLNSIPQEEEKMKQFTKEVIPEILKYL
ncbi:MAG: EpsI family protein [Spirochaetes bacterium]|nr:EpsI family protein [Spirochaetota bacterium]